MDFQVQNVNNMPSVGYSGTPLYQKLGLKPDFRIVLLHPPAEYPDWLATDMSGQVARKGETPDWVHLFAASRTIFEKEMRALARIWKANPAVVIWVSWYKKSSGISTDLTEDTVRNYALQHGLVDVKVCAVSDHWSGLKLVVPLNRR